MNCLLGSVSYSVHWLYLLIYAWLIIVISCMFWLVQWIHHFLLYISIAHWCIWVCVYVCDTMQLRYCCDFFFFSFCFFFANNATACNELGNQTPGYNDVILVYVTVAICISTSEWRSVEISVNNSLCTFLYKVEDPIISNMCVCVCHRYQNKQNGLDCQ